MLHTDLVTQKTSFEEKIKHLHSVLWSIRQTKILVTKITIVSSPNWVERIRIY